MARCPWRWAANQDVHGHDYDTDPRFLRTKVITRDRSAQGSVTTWCLPLWLMRAVVCGTVRYIARCDKTGHNDLSMHLTARKITSYTLSPLRTARWDCEAFCHDLGDCNGFVVSGTNCDLKRFEKPAAYQKHLEMTVPWSASVRHGLGKRFPSLGAFLYLSDSLPPVYLCERNAEKAERHEP